MATATLSETNICEDAEDRTPSRTGATETASNPVHTTEGNRLAEAAKNHAGLTTEEVNRLDGYLRAANYLSVGQIYLRDNPLLRAPLDADDIKPRLLGHWGTAPGLNLIDTHCNRIIRERDADLLFITGPGHGGPALFAQTWLEGSLTELQPELRQNTDGMCQLFRQFSAPGGVPSHCGPETPGSIHEGGELGYSLSHAFGAVIDNPDLVAVCVVGDGEAETGPLAAAWQSGRFLNPTTDGAVLPVVHLNGYKIANPTILSRIPEPQLAAYFRGLGYFPLVVELDADDPPETVHQRMAVAMDEAFDMIAEIQYESKHRTPPLFAEWPVILLKTPKGWTGPHEVDGKLCEGSFRSHQVPLKETRSDPAQRAMLEDWLRSYRPEELFDETGGLKTDLQAAIPRPRRRMGLSKHAIGGVQVPLCLPEPSCAAVDTVEPGFRSASATRQLGQYLRELYDFNDGEGNFLLVGPDETESNRLGDVFDRAPRRWMLPFGEGDANLSHEGRVFEILSEHTCLGWLEGYLLTGRHGLISSYEAFMPIVSSMVAQHAKWLDVSRDVPWRQPIASLNVLLTSHVWRQDHNGFSHQDPGFVDQILNKKPEIVRSYFPPDANTLLCVADECLRSRGRINVIVAGKQVQPQWLDLDAAKVHVRAGAGIWDWACNDCESGERPDVVLACCGDVPTIETLAAASILRERQPGLAVRVVNVVDLACLQRKEHYAGGLSDEAFSLLFPPGVPVVFAFHGYPSLVHRMIYKRPGHADFHVQGFQEEGSTTTPFDMLVRNDLDRFHLVAKVAQYADLPDAAATRLRREMHESILRHRAFVVSEGIDLPEITNWRWTNREPSPCSTTVGHGCNAADPQIHAEADDGSTGVSPEQVLSELGQQL